MILRRLCVFCGSSGGANADYAAAARDLGAALAERRIELVYGGGNIGLMGVLADAVLERGGAVTGVIPESLRARELAHGGLSRLHVVDSMHARKAMMADLSDGFVALPGGLGTLEELLEIATWAQLDLHERPIGLANVAGYFNPLLSMLDRAVAERFLRPEHRELLLVAEDPRILVERMAALARPPEHRRGGRDVR